MNSSNNLKGNAVAVAACMVAMVAAAPGSAQPDVVVKRELVVINDGSSLMGGNCLTVVDPAGGPTAPPILRCRSNKPFIAQLAALRRVVRRYLPHAGSIAITVVMSTAGTRAVQAPNLQGWSGPVQVVPRTVLTGDSVAGIVTKLEQAT